MFDLSLDWDRPNRIPSSPSTHTLRLRLQPQNAQGTNLPSNLTLKLEVAEGVSIQGFCQYRPKFLPLEEINPLEISLPKLHAGELTDILIEVKVSPLPQEESPDQQTILSLSLRGEGLNLQTNASLHCTNSYSEAQQPNNEVNEDRLGWLMNRYTTEMSQTKDLGTTRELLLSVDLEIEEKTPNLEEKFYPAKPKNHQIPVITTGNIHWQMLEGLLLHNQYHLKQCIEIGGFGAVYRAQEVIADRFLRDVAVEISPIMDMDQHLRTLQTALDLNHPNLLRCFTAGQTTFQHTQEFFFLVMEPAEQSLAKLQEEGMISPDVLKPIIQNVASGLEALHQDRLVHRCLKPGNVLQVGQNWKIADFSLLHQITSHFGSDSTDNRVGIPNFMPPEGFSGEISTAWDMWSLGVMIVYLLTGNFPFRAESHDMLIKQIQTGQLQIPQLPSPYEEIVAGCLQYDRQQRWTANQVLDRLDRV